MTPPNRLAPAVAPLEPGGARPLWSVMVPTHDCADYLRRTLASVLAQDPGPDEMQIEVVDDCSTRDDPEAVVRELGRGRVGFHRRPRNGGAIANFNTCIARARGRWLHILHGDDLVAPGFYAAMRAAAEAGPAVGAAFCRCSVIDEHDREVELYALERDTPGVLEGFIERLGVWSRIQAPTIVVARAVYEALGGFDPRLVHAADWEMWQRIAVHRAVWYEPRPLARYRQRGLSDSARLVRTGRNIADIRQAIEIAHQYVPRPIATRIRREALVFYGEAAVGTAKRMLAGGDAGAARAQLAEAIACFRRAGRPGRALRLTASWVKLALRGHRTGPAGADARAAGHV